MSDEPRQHDLADDALPPAEREDVSFKGIVIFTVALTVLVAVTGLAMYGMTVMLRDAEVAQDPPPPALPEARRPHEPPTPRLQADPILDMEELRYEEEAELSSYGWIDEAAGIARVPVQRAIELLVEDGLPEPPPPAEVAGDSPATSEREGDAR